MNAAYLRTRYRAADIAGIHDNMLAEHELSSDRVRKLPLRQIKN